MASSVTPRVLVVAVDRQLDRDLLADELDGGPVALVLERRHETGRTDGRGGQLGLVELLLGLPGGVRPFDDEHHQQGDQRRGEGRQQPHPNRHSAHVFVPPANTGTVPVPSAHAMYLDFLNQCRYRRRNSVRSGRDQRERIVTAAVPGAP